MKTTIAQISPQITHTPEQLFEFMQKDKKAKDDSIGFILVKGIGQAFQTYDVQKEDVLDILQQSIEA